jgi:hypothetical protein
MGAACTRPSHLSVRALSFGFSEYTTQRSPLVVCRHVCVASACVNAFLIMEYRGYSMYCAN